MIKLFIADDHELFREGLKSLLSREKDIEIVGSASDGLEAVNAVRRLKPEVVLMDVTMPNMNGIQATAKICSELPDIAVIVHLHAQRQALYRRGAESRRARLCPERELPGADA